jgi:hypothetical protein
MANVNISWALTEGGLQNPSTYGWVVSDNGNGAGTRIRYNMEASSNCGGTNSATQTITPLDVNYDMTVNLSGVGEGQDPGFEALTMTINTPDVTGTIRTAAASGGGLGCTVRPVTITTQIPSPYYLPKGIPCTLTIDFSSRDGLYHTTACFYQVDLSFEIVDPPTNIQSFTGNTDPDETTITLGEPVVLAWNTLWNGQSSAYTASINQGIGNVTPLDSGSVTVYPTVTTTYILTVTGSTGTVTKQVIVTVLPPDSEPDLFTFATVENAELSTSYTSETVTISGLGTVGTVVSVNVTATNGAETSVAGGAFSTATKTITNGQTLRVRMTSSSNYNTNKTTTVTVGSVSNTWTILTKAPPSQIPNAFSFNDVTEAPLQTYTNSNIVTITGITASTTVTSPTNGFETSVNGGAFSTAAKTISNGQTLQLRVLTTNVLGETKSTTVIVGGGSPVPWNVTNVLVADSSPNFFDIIDVIGANPSTLTSSLPVTITGINVPSTVTTTNNAQLRINGGSWVDSPTTINVNETLQVRLTSSPDPGGLVSTVVTIGNNPSTSLSDTWNLYTTTDNDTIPDPFNFVNRPNQAPGVLVTSNTVQIKGITAAAPVTVTGGAQFSINGGSWVTSGNINNNDTLTIRITSSSTLGGNVSTSISIGN